MNAPEPLWTVKDVMAYLQVSRSWVYQRVERGEIPCRRLLGCVRFEPAAVRAWVAGDPKGHGQLLPFSKANP